MATIGNLIDNVSCKRMTAPLNSHDEYPNKKPNTSISYENSELINNMDIDPSKSVKARAREESPQWADYPGVLMALCAKGIQDAYVERANTGVFDARLQFLTQSHQFSYQQIRVNKSGSKSKKTYTLERDCDLVNRIDIALPNPHNLPLNKILKTIETEVGGQRIDKIGCSSDNSFDIETLIKTDCALFKRKISHINGTTFVPLSMAPLYDHNLIQPSCQHHEFKIHVEYTKEYIDASTDANANHVENVKLYGNVYYLEIDKRRQLFQTSHEFITIQHQWTGSEKMVCGHTAFKLNFNHPVYLLYFWGFDKSKVRNIKIVLNGQDFYNGSAEALEHYKSSRGYDVEPMMFFFSQDDFDKPAKCTVNFSRIDSAQLIIQSDQHEATDVHIIGLNVQPVRFSSGMMGLAFSK